MRNLLKQIHQVLYLHLIITFSDAIFNSRYHKILSNKWVGWLITFGAIVIVSLAHWTGIFDTMELKMYDYRFDSVRGPINGLDGIRFNVYQ